MKMEEVKSILYPNHFRMTGFVENGVAKVQVRFRGEQATVVKVLRLLPDLARLLRISPYDSVAEKRKSPLGKSEL